MKIRNPAVNWCVARLATWLLKLFFLTVKVENITVVDDATPYRKSTGKRRYCFCLWHDAIVACVFGMPTFSLSGLISRHQDGSYLTHAAQLVGITPVRGSASRGGAQATRQLIDMPELHVCITPDGPRGPRRVMKDGIVYLSSRTDRPVVPTTVVASRYWRIPGGWSDMIVPKPFSQLLLIAGTPIEIAEGLSREEIATQAEAIQIEMDRLDMLGQRIIAGDESAKALIRQPGVYPDDSIKTQEEKPSRRAA